jgi:tRNA A37 methylthiotransferase MiaB
MRVFLKGLNSCGMRRADVRRYRDFLAASGHELVADPAASDLVLLWTCAFREDQRQNALAEIERYVREYRAAVVVAGCLPDIDPETLRARFSGRVIGWRDEQPALEALFATGGPSLAQMPRLLGEPRLCDDVDRFRRENPDRDAAFIDQFNKLFIAEGCRFECSYCTERLAFPPYRSFPEDDLVAECRRLVAATGAHDVVLLGDSIGDYGHDIGTTLPRLMHRLQEAEPRLRLAIQGLNPAHFLRFFDELVGFVERGEILHLQLPIQSASDRILRLMQRPYDQAGIEKVYGALGALGFHAYDSHIIIGFPGETEADLEETLEFLLRHRPNYVLASGFMATPRAAAHHLPDQVAHDVKLARLRLAERRIKDAGIICNADYSELGAERCRRLNSLTA